MATVWRKPMRQLWLIAAVDCTERVAVIALRLRGDIQLLRQKRRRG